MNTLEMNGKVSEEKQKIKRRHVNVRTEEYSKWKKIPLDGLVAECDEKSVYLKKNQCI